MSDWTTLKLSAIAQLITKGATPTTYGHEYAEFGIAFVRVNNISENGRLDLDRCLFIGSITHALFSRSQLHANDVLISIAGSIGRTAVVEAITLPANCNQAVALVRLEVDYEPRFIARLLASNLGRAQIAASTVQLAQANLSLRQVGDLQFRFPPYREQQGITNVIDSIDATIHHTEAIIEKLKLVKQGLLHDLLTRGIDANGELRPQQSQAPHLYKDSLLGSIPRTWSVERLDGLLSNEQPAMRSGPFGSALLKCEQVESGVPLLGIDNVHTEEFIDKFTRFVPITKFHELSRYAVRPDDLMITIMGTVGRCCLVPSGIGRALSSKHTWTITLDQSKYSPLLAMLQINYSLRILEQLARDEQGGIMSAIRSDTLRSLHFPVPPIKEQIEMAERMQAITSRINTESEVLRKLTCEKFGLMDDLLTGRVRVTSLLGTTDA